MRRDQLVVVGNGMVGHKFVESMVDAGALESWSITVVGDEPRPAYDRVALSSWFTGTSADELSLASPDWYEIHGVDLHTGERATAIDRHARTVATTSAATLPYDHLVLATGSSPNVPAIDNCGAAGCFTYRTIADLEAITAWAVRPEVRTGVVVGGGLLGLEAAGALRLLGLDTHVVEFAPRLMPAQVDEGGSLALQARIEDLGVAVHTSRAAAAVLVHEAGPRAGRVRGLSFGTLADSPAPLAADLVVFSAGIRPRDELARACGLDTGERGGISVDDRLTTSDPSISAIGEVALHRGRVYGLVGPGYEMARVLARVLTGNADAAFAGADMSTKLKLMGVDVASFGDAFAATPGTREIVFADGTAKLYKKLVVVPAVAAGGSGTATTARVVGGILVGDASAYTTLVQMARGDLPTPPRPEQLIVPIRDDDGRPVLGVGGLSGNAVVCSCNNVTNDEVRAAIGAGNHSVADIKRSTGAGTSCGGCVPLIADIMKHELAKSGFELTDHLCEHFAMSRRDLFALIRVHGYSSFSEVLAHRGRGLGCEICKPAVASILASLANGYILDGEQAAIQDTNDHFLANLQKDGTYSVVPRIPGGEITPEGLITIGEVARDFGLYTKITGGQRIDLLGARTDQLPAIWQRLVDAGFESGHAYGKAVRTVKSCVGSAWCRFGVQDSVSMAIALELRYRGLRAPHKVKLAVSGCARECAEARGKDVGVVATERGWSLYVCGNGGMRPQHAVLFAEDLDDATLVRYIDRFLMLYVRSADALERTAAWFNRLEGGLDHLRSVIISDDLGIASELEADMQRHVDTYECEWKATLADPKRLQRFTHFVNAPSEPDPGVVFVTERHQIRPATANEKRHAIPALAAASKASTDVPGTAHGTRSMATGRPTPVEVRLP